MKEYDYILPITIVDEYYQKILEHFGDKVIQLDRYRSKKLSDDWYHKYNKGDSLVNEVEYAIEDVYLSSQCNHVLGSSSNFFLMTLFMNKDMTYDLINEVAHINGS